jgi:hypothetical protein
VKFARLQEGTLPVTTPGEAGARAGDSTDPRPPSPSRAWRSPARGLRSLRALLAAHRWFAIIVAVAAALRVVVALGYPPAMFFNDSYNYITDSVFRAPDIVRANGYPFFLAALLPAHSLALVTALQAAMGLAIGIGIYALLRRRGLPWWGASIPALPVLFDVWELQLEHMIAADTLFTLLTMAVLVLACWWDRPPVWALIVAGLLTGYSATVRSVGEPMIVVLAVGLLLRRVGWRRVAAATAAGLAPLAGYVFWFHAHYGGYALTQASGTFLYSRVSSFADCQKMNPGPDLRVLCDSRPPGQREGSQEYLWANDTPLGTLTGTNNIYRFTPHINSLTKQFAKRAILSQPLDYVAVVADDTWRTFGWTRFRSDLAGSGDKFRFEPTVLPVPTWVTGNKVNRAAATDYGGATFGRPAVVQPWARFLWHYEQFAYLPGSLLGGILLTGLAGIAAAARRRRARDPVRERWGWGGLGLLPWLAGAALIILPPVTAGFSYRYVVSAVPAACLAAGLAFAGRGNLLTRLRDRRSKPQPQVSLSPTVPGRLSGPGPAPVAASAP